MNAKVSDLFEMICSEYQGADLGKKAAQKLFYFMEREGISLNLRYGIHYYGPYSPKLSDIMDELETEQQITIDDSGSTHIIKWIGGKSDKAALDEKEINIANRVISNLKNRTPVELEALSTIDYVDNVLLNSRGTRQEVIDRFLSIKGRKFTKEAANNYYDEVKRICGVA